MITYTYESMNMSQLNQYTRWIFGVIAESSCHKLVSNRHCWLHKEESNTNETHFAQNSANICEENQNPNQNRILRLETVFFFDMRICRSRTHLLDTIQNERKIELRLVHLRAHWQAVDSNCFSLLFETRHLLWVWVFQLVFGVKSVIGTI